MPILYRGRVFAVEVERRLFPNGQTHEVEIVRHPPSIVLLAVEDDGRVVLVRQYRPSVGKEMWELPAGSLHEGETAESAAERECEEEIGRVPARLERLAGLFPAPGFCDEELIFFRASGLRTPDPDSGRAPDEDEDIHAEAFPLEEARAMVKRGVIVDLKTAFGLTLA